MKIDDINHKATVNSIIKYNIDISSLDNLIEVRQLIRSVKLRTYRLAHKEYFRIYSLDYGRCERNLKWIRELPGF